MFFLFFFLSFQDVRYPIEGGSIYLGGSAVAGGIIAVLNDQDQVLFFDENLHLINAISRTGNVDIFPFKNSIIILETELNSNTVLVEGGKKVTPLGAFKPRSISTDRGRLAFWPLSKLDWEIDQGSMSFFLEKDSKVIQKFSYENEKITIEGERIVPITRGISRTNMNHKGFWIFEKNGFLEIIIQPEPAVFKERDQQFETLDLPGFVYQKEPIALTRKIFEYPELRQYRMDWVVSASRILGAFRFNCGFVLSYIDPGYPWPEFTRLAFFDLDWRRYGQIQAIPGRLIGVHKDQGYMHTFRDENWRSELRKVELKP